MYNLYIDMGKNVIIRLKNKKSGVVYVYYGQSAYSKDGRCTTKGLRKLIGKMNSQDEFEQHFPPDAPGGAARHRPCPGTILPSV